MSATLLPALRQLAVQMQQLGDHLPPFAAVLGADNVAYVRDSSGSLVRMVEELAGRGGNPLQDKEVRHDLRNLVAVVKGFSDLMRMDLPASHAVSPSVRQLISLSDQFIAALDTVRGPGEASAAPA
jgi:hypothetical protein